MNIHSFIKNFLNFNNEFEGQVVTEMRMLLKFQKRHKSVRAFVNKRAVLYQ